MKEGQGTSMKHIGVLIIGSLLVLTACLPGATTVNAPVAVDNVTAVDAPVGTEIDLLSLPREVDVATVASIRHRADVTLIDVREPWEHNAVHIPDTLLIPMNEVPRQLDAIPTDKTVIVYCRSGNRSGQITNFLRRQGYERVHNMRGGIIAWERARYPVEKEPR